MSDHEVQISLPITSVRRAWLRYAGHGEFDSDGEDGDWRESAGEGSSATFTSVGPQLTSIALHSPDAGEGDKDATALIEGFVAYVNAAHAELEATPGAITGAALAGPDGTAHMPEQPEGLGTDSAAANVTAARHAEQATSGE